jgi:hypothetical protein
MSNSPGNKRTPEKNSDADSRLGAKEIRATFLVSLAVLFTSASMLFPGVKSFAAQLVHRAMMTSDFNSSMWSIRLGKIALVFVFVSALGLAFCVLRKTQRDAVIKRAATLLHRVPAWAYIVPGVILFTSLYFGKNINLSLVIVAWVLWKARFLDFVRGIFGARAVRIAVITACCAFVALTFVMVFYRLSVTLDIFGGADSPRVFQDINITARKGYAYNRVYTHPLYVLIWHTVYSLFAPLNGAGTIAMRFMLISVASLNVGLFSLFISTISKSSPLNYLGSAVLLFSAPTLLQGGQIVETFILSQFSILLSVLYFSYAFGTKKINYFALLALSLLVVGCNLVYILVFVIFFICLMFRAHFSKKTAVLRLIGFGLLFLAVFSLLIYVQYFAFGKNTYMPRSINGIIKRAIDGRATFIQHVSLLSYVKSYFSVALYWAYPAWIRQISSLLTVLWAVVLVPPFIFFKKIEKKSLFVSLVLSNIVIFLFHFKYDPEELSLFGPVTGILLLLLVPFGFYGLKRTRVWSILLTVILASEMVVNIPGVANIYRIDGAVSGANAVGSEDTFEVKQFTTSMSKSGVTVQDFNNENFVYKSMTSSLGKELIKSSENKDLSLSVIPPLTVTAASPSFTFGMGDRTKYLLQSTWQQQDGVAVVKSLDSGDVVATLKASTVTVDAARYCVSGESETGERVAFVENEKGVFRNGKVLKGTDTKVDIPDFSDYKYPELMKVLYHEMMFQIIDGKPLTTLGEYSAGSGTRYSKISYRSAAMIGMFLSSIGQEGQISDWIATMEEPYDEVKSVREPDNLGEALYLQSLLPKAQRNQTLIDKIIKEARRIRDGDGNLTGTTDGAKSSAYQNGWLIFGLKKLGLGKIASEFNAHSTIDDNGYSALLWFILPQQKTTGSGKAVSATGESLSSTYTNVDGQHYPYFNVAKSHFNMLEGKEYQAPVVSQLEYPVSWGAGMRSNSLHDAELLMYLQELKK